MIAVAAEPSTGRRRSKLTIGTVCNLLRDEFGDISISKIRFLEEQGLITPRRTAGGYRLYTDDDVDQLRTVLRMQRDEFLPLAVIRQVISRGGPGRNRRPRLVGRDTRLTLEELLNHTDAELAFVRELEEYGLLDGRGGDAGYSSVDAEIVALCQRLARYGVAGRHLRTVRSAVERESGLLEQILAPSLRSPNQDRREAGLQELEVLADLTSQLTHLLLVRDLMRAAR